MDITVGSLFAGVGGFDLGMERAGMRPAWQVEIDPHARAVLAHHWPDARQLEDVRKVGAHNLERVDVIVGGFPCQDLSVAGNRAGLAGGRSGLFYESRYARNGRGAPSDVVLALAAQSGATGKGDAAPLVQIAHTLRASWDASEDGTGRGTPLVAGTVSSKWAKGTGGPAGDEAYNLTLQAGVRRLTPTECERLQGFPDGWTAGQADAHRYRQMGNAVCVPVVEWIGRRAVAWLEGQRLEAQDG